MKNAVIQFILTQVDAIQGMNTMSGTASRSQVLCRYREDRRYRPISSSKLKKTWYRKLTLEMTGKMA